MNENKVTPAMLANTPPSIDVSELPLYNSELQYRVYTDTIKANFMGKQTTQTFSNDGTPFDADQD